MSIKNVIVSYITGMIEEVKSILGEAHYIPDTHPIIPTPTAFDISEENIESS